MSHPPYANEFIGHFVDDFTELDIQDDDDLAVLRIEITEFSQTHSVALMAPEVAELIAVLQGWLKDHA